MPKKLTTEEFIAKAKQVHGDRYDYSVVEYIGSNKKVKIHCPAHGVFLQRPNDHLTGYGCNSCAIQERTYTTEKFITEAKRIHHDKYSYPKVNYINTRTQITIICPVHGDFKQTPHSHLSGRGCNDCGNELAMYSTEEFINKAMLKHSDKKYDYSNVVYQGISKPVIITCPIHGDFEQIPSVHLQGHGCPKCAKYGFDKTKPGYLYYLKITTDLGQILYKIGITNRSVNERFNLTDLNKIEIVKQKLYENGADALNWETKLKRKYKKYQYKGPDILSSGNTELFTEDIMELWYNQ